MIIPANPKAQYLAHQEEINEAIRRVVESGNYILGKEVDSFENQFAQYIGVNYGIGVGNGTEALRLALAMCGIGIGDEVITVSHTAVATVSAIEMAGAVPVFVDIESDFFTINPKLIEKSIGPKTKAIIPVHIYGQSADLDPIVAIAQKHGLRVIEDCAQAHGAFYKKKRVGSIGDIGCFSFYPTKNLGALGDGGMVVTNSPEMAGKARLFREYGWKERFISEIAGWNTRLDELHAAVLSVKLKYLDQDNLKRNEIALLYKSMLKHSDGLVLPKERADCKHVYHLFVIRTKLRNELREFLKKNEVLASIQYPVPIHLQPAYCGVSEKAHLDETEKTAGEILSLPIYPELSGGEIETVCSFVNHFNLQFPK